jgi:hypothetical protein
MKRILIILTVLFGFQMHAQDPFLQKDSDAMEAKAKEITQKYDAELGLTAKQAILFQKKVEEFLIRRQNVNNAFTGKERLDQLLILQTNETAEMGNILTQIQLDRYKKFRPIFQPLDRVDDQ